MRLVEPSSRCLALRSIRLSLAAKLAEGDGGGRQATPRRGKKPDALHFDFGSPPLDGILL
jgi:hypothetical protein